MAPLLNAGTAWRGPVQLPQRFSLRAYVSREDLDDLYVPFIPKAVTPEEGSSAQLAEQLARLATQEHGALPPRHEPLWTLPFSAAPLARHELLDPSHDFPVYHPPQRLRRSAQLAAASQQQTDHPLIPLLLDEEEIKTRGEEVGAEHFLPLYARESDWTVPVSWFSLFTREDRVEFEHEGSPRHRLAVPANIGARRAAWAAGVLKATDREDLQELGSDLSRMQQWADAFTATSLICLDYGSIADPLQPDDSPRDLDDALHLVDDGDIDGAAVAFRRLMLRWMPLAQLEHAS